MKKISVLFLLLFIVIIQACSANYQSDFSKYFENNDFVNQLKTLKLWEKSSPNDAELYTCYFNYYFAKSQEEIISLSAEKPNGAAFLLQDSTGKVAGYLGSEIKTDLSNFKLCIKKIDEGISHYPNRLDMRFGKIYALGQVKDWGDFTNEIIRAVKFSKENGNNWTWANNENKEDGKDFFLGSLQDYQLQLYNTGDDKLLAKMRDIAIAVLEIYPNHIESLSNISITYIISKNYDKAIEVLLRAESINPKDGIVLMNLANGYKLKGDKDKSIKYFEKALKYVDDESKDYAKKQITELSK